MASSYENNDMGLVEMDLEVFEIDGDLLRELLEEQEDKDDDDGNVECVAEDVLEGKVNNPNMMNMEQERQQQNYCLEPYECHSVDDFEWLNNMMDTMMEPTANNPLSDVIINWSSDDDIVGMVDFGYANGECYSQMYDGFLSNEASYNCLWENYDI